MKSKFFLCLLFSIIVLSRIDEMRLEFRIPSTNCELVTNKYTIHIYIFTTYGSGKGNGNAYANTNANTDE